MADVFLSYARPSINEAMRIADCLRTAGCSVWFDESLPAHRHDALDPEDEGSTAQALPPNLQSHGAGLHSPTPLGGEAPASKSGRSGTELSSRLDRKKFLLPGAERKAIINLWSAGQLQAADEAIKAAVARWPKQRQVWRTQIAYLLYSGRASEALAILNDAHERPLDVLPGLIDAASATARALRGEISRKDGVAANLDYLKTDPGLALAVAQACAAMDDAATSFDLLDGYYFARDRWASLAPAAGDQVRQTSPLFQPPMRRLWSDERFGNLVRRIGLTDYWKRSGTRPDYERA